MERQIGIGLHKIRQFLNAGPDPYVLERAQGDIKSIKAIARKIVSSIEFQRASLIERNHSYGQGSRNQIP